MAQFPLLSGTLLDKGRYEIESVLGGGGFGITYKALDKRTGCRVAIKEFFPVDARREGNNVASAGVWKSWASSQWKLSPESRQKREMGPSPFEKYRADLIREANQIAPFYHPHIVDVHRSFEENNTAYLVMQFIEGESLTQYLEDHEGMRLPIDEILLILKCIGEALHYAHFFEMIHRDVTPNNILREQSTGHYFLIDFGLAREFDEFSEKSLTMLGTAGYASPEQDRGEKQGPYSDVYSLAAVTYYLATGYRPMKSTERLDAGGRDLLPSPRHACPDLPEWFEQAILKGMSLNPADRPATIMEFLALLTPGNMPAKRTTRIPYQSLASQELDLLHKESRDLREQLGQTANQLTEAQQALRNRESRIQSLETIKIKSEARINDLQNEIIRLNELLQASDKNQIEKLQNEKRVAMELATGAQSRIDKAENRAKEAEKRVERAINEKAEIEKQIDAITVQIRQAEARATRAEAELKTLKNTSVVTQSSDSTYRWSLPLLGSTLVLTLSPFAVDFVSQMVYQTLHGELRIKNHILNETIHNSALPVAFGIVLFGLLLQFVLTQNTAKAIPITPARK